VVFGLLEGGWVLVGVEIPDDGHVGGTWGLCGEGYLVGFVGWTGEH
jgi:hypothetical protein